MHNLIIFDVDGTLTPGMDGATFPDAVVAKLITLRSTNAKLALASNQGGVGFRHWIESVGGFGKTPEEKATSLASATKYPTVQAAMARLAEVAGNVTVLTGLTCRIYACYAYQSKAGYWGPVPQDSGDDPMWSMEWRKPNPGMLFQAMTDAGIQAADTLMIGDRPEDEQAASAAGVAFAWASDYFAAA